MAPKFGETVKDVTVKAGQPLKVVAPYTSYPQPDSAILFENSVPEEGLYQATLTEELLTVNLTEPQRPKDCGQLTLKLNNEFGEDTTSVNVTVVGKLYAFR